MSLLPHAFFDRWGGQDLDRHSVFDHNFALPLNHENLLDRHDHILRNRRPSLYRHYHPYDRSLFRRPSTSNGVSMLQTDKNKFEVILDVQQFAPEEIKVKVVDGNVIVEGKHEEKQDEHGFISRQFSRKYLVPKDCNVDEITTTLSSDRVLIVSVPKKELPKPQEKVITIQHTGKPAVKNVTDEKPVPQSEADDTVKAA